MHAQRQFKNGSITVPVRSARRNQRYRRSTVYHVILREHCCSGRLLHFVGSSEAELLGITRNENQRPNVALQRQARPTSNYSNEKCRKREE